MVPVTDNTTLSGPSATSSSPTLVSSSPLPPHVDYANAEGIYTLLFTSFMTALLIGFFGAIAAALLPFALAHIVTTAGAILLSVPVVVLVNRAIVTPYRVPNVPLTALNVLLTRYEQASPWLMLKTPGLVLGLALSTLNGNLLTAVGPHVMNTRPVPQLRLSRDAHIAICVVLPLLDTLWTVPLDVAVTKLSVQSHSQYSVASDSDDLEAAALEPLRVSDEEVVALRPGPHYTGLVDAFRTIVAEEGRGALYRGWGWTLLGNCIIAVTFVAAILYPVAAPQELVKRVFRMQVSCRGLATGAHAHLSNRAGHWNMR